MKGPSLNAFETLLFIYIVIITAGHSPLNVLKPFLLLPSIPGYTIFSMPTHVITNGHYPRAISSNCKFPSSLRKLSQEVILKLLSM